MGSVFTGVQCSHPSDKLESVSVVVFLPWFLLSTLLQSLGSKALHSRFDLFVKKQATDLLHKVQI